MADAACCRDQRLHASSAFFPREVGAPEARTSSSSPAAASNTRYLGLAAESGMTRGDDLQNPHPRRFALALLPIACDRTSPTHDHHNEHAPGHPFRRLALPLRRCRFGCYPC
eukprot:351134-Chlamydomonas_euryale.AAC.2